MAGVGPSQASGSPGLPHTLWWVLPAPPSLRHPDLHLATPPAAPMAPFPFFSCFMVSVEDQMLVALGTQGERVIQEDSSPLQTPGKAQESVCGPCPQGLGCVWAGFHPTPPTSEGQPFLGPEEH